MLLLDIVHEMSIKIAVGIILEVSPRATRVYIQNNVSSLSTMYCVC